MEPITRLEKLLATAAGEYEGTLPPPKTREDIYLLNIIEKINSLGMTPQEIDTAIAEYLNTHDADIVTEQELSDALAGYYDKGAVDTAQEQDDIFLNVTKRYKKFRRLTRTGKPLKQKYLINQKMDMTIAC